jgi:hypothetical protein
MSTNDWSQVKPRDCKCFHGKENIYCTAIIFVMPKRFSKEDDVEANQAERWLFLDVVVRKRAAVFQLLSYMNVRPSTEKENNVCLPPDQNGIPGSY